MNIFFLFFSQSGLKQWEASIEKLKSKKCKVSTHIVSDAHHAREDFRHLFNGGTDKKLHLLFTEKPFSSHDLKCPVLELSSLTEQCVLEAVENRAPAA